jgi:hypothetical protein
VMKTLAKNVSFKQGSFVSCHLTLQGNLTDHILYDTISGSVVHVMGIIKVDKSSIWDDDGSKICLVDEIIYACYSLSAWNYGCIHDVLAYDLKTPTANQKEEALAHLISKGDINILSIPFFADNVFKPFIYK